MTHRPRSRSKAASRRQTHSEAKSTKAPGENEVNSPQCRITDPPTHEYADPAARRPRSPQAPATSQPFANPGMLQPMHGIIQVHMHTPCIT